MVSPSAAAPDHRAAHPHRTPPARPPPPLARPLRLRTLDRVDGRAVQGKARIPPEIRALARVGHGAKDEFAFLEDSLDTGDPRRPVGPDGGNRLVPVRVEQR